MKTKLMRKTGDKFYRTFTSISKGACILSRRTDHG